MSVLLPDADEKATLDAALAFLEGYEDVTTDSSGVELPLTASKARAPARCATPQQKQQQQAAKKRSKPRRKYPNSSSTVLQRRKKAEILMLRNQVEILDEQLQQLKKLPGATYPLEQHYGGVVVQHTGYEPSSWAEHAAVQFRLRHQAEKTNAKLKSIMANQIKVSEALRSLLQKTAMLDGMDFLHPDPCRPLVDGIGGMELLERRVEGLYLDADSVYLPDATTSISMEAIVKQNYAQGKTVEIISTTPMKCSVKSASDTLWKWFSLTKSLHNRPNILERNYTLLLESEIGTLEFKKQNFVRRYEEADRVIIIWADILRLPQYNLQFRNHSWLFITPSVDAPEDASVLRTFQQLFVDVDGSHPMQGTPLAQESAFQALGKLYRRYLQFQQNTMVEDTCPPPTTTGIEMTV